MNKKAYLVLTAVLAAFVAGTMFSAPAAITAVGEPVLFKGGVICACVNSGSGECYEGMDGAACQHNVITTAGKNAIESYLGQQGYAAFDYLALGNGTAPVAGDTALDGETAVSGLTRVQGTYYSNGDGNWSIVHTWTAAGSASSINSTALFNESSSGTMLAGGTFTSVNLETNDQLTINYTLWIS